MDHIGIDLGSKESQVCVRNAGGEIVEETRSSTRRLGTFLTGRPATKEISAWRVSCPGIALKSERRAPSRSRRF